MRWGVGVMNYIWELVIRAGNNGIDTDLIEYRCGQPFSAYMELSFNEINERGIPLDEPVEVNPFYRYYKIFKKLLDPNLNENQEVVDAVLDISLHHLSDIDVLMGMNKREYYINFVIEDMKNGCLGSHIQKNIKVFTRDEQVIIADSLLALYSTGEEVNLLKESVKRIFKGAYIFSNAEERDEVVFFLRTKKTEEKEEKMALLQYLFLPFKCTCEIYWERIFGIIDVPELMVMGAMVQY